MTRPTELSLLALFLRTLLRAFEETAVPLGFARAAVPPRNARVPPCFSPGAAPIRQTPPNKTDSSKAARALQSPSALAVRFLVLPSPRLRSLGSAPPPAKAGCSLACCTTKRWFDNRYSLRWARLREWRQSRPRRDIRLAPARMP